jgi:pentose-5-phosphate-3-epimerase
MITIIPSILVQTKQDFLAQLSALEHRVTHLQLDIADGKFVPNITWGEPDVVRTIEGYTFELHLMDESPLETIALWRDVSPVTRFIIHVESVTDISTTIAHAQTYGREVFLALNPIPLFRPFMTTRILSMEYSLWVLPLDFKDKP